MYSVKEAAQRTGVSIRTLHHYDRIGLLKPAKVGNNGYRAYDDASLERLRCILLYRELDFSLSDIKQILDSADFDRETALTQQICLLELQRERLDRIIAMARKMKETGGTTMSFDAFDNQKLNRYANEAKEAWGHTDAYREYEQKSKGRSQKDERQLGDGLMQVLAGFQPLMDRPAEDAAVQAQVAALQQYITTHFYTCSNDVLCGLGQMYAAGGEMTDNIDRACGEGVAAFAAQAIEAFCAR